MSQESTSANIVPLTGSHIGLISFISIILGGVGGVGTHHITLGDLDRRTDMLESKAALCDYRLTVLENAIDLKPARRVVANEKKESK